MTTRYSLILAMALVWVGCGEKSSFNGDHRSAAKAPASKPSEAEPVPADADNASPSSEDSEPAPAPTSPAPSNPVPTTPVPKDCTEAGVTQVKLLTPQFKNNAPNQKVRFSVSLVDCHGQPKALPDAPLSFGINAYFSGAVPSLSYRVLVGNHVISQGVLQSVVIPCPPGVTVTCYDTRTANIALDTSRGSLELEIDVSYLDLLRKSDHFAKTEYVSETLHRFFAGLKHGNALPVFQPVLVEYPL